MLPLTVLLAALHAAAPEEDHRNRFVLSANVFPDLLLAYGPLWQGEGIHALEGELTLSPWVSAYLGGGWTQISGGSDLLGNWSGPTGYVGARFYPLGLAPSGWWVSVDGFAMGGDRSAPLDAFGPGVSTGYRFQGERWSLLVGLGARLAFVSDYGGGLYVLPSIQISPGFAF